MASIGQGFRGGAGGAGIGFAVGGPVGAAIGGGLGFLTGLFEDSPEEERQRRMDELLKQIRQLRTEAETRFQRDVSQQTAGYVGEARQAAARRAAAMGREGDTESLTLPATQNITRELGRIRSQGLQDISRQFDSAEMQAQLGFADRPIEPSVSDYLMEIGGTAANFGMAYDALNAQKEFNKSYLQAIGGQGFDASGQQRVNDFLGSQYGAVTSPYFRDPVTVMRRDQPSLFGGFYKRPGQ